MKTLFWFLLAASALAITGCGSAPQLAATAAAPSSSDPSSTSPTTPTTPPANPPSTPPSTPSDPPSTPPSNPPSAPSDPAPSAPSSPAGATTLSNIQASSGWESWGQLAPLYTDCAAPCPGVAWSMTQSLSSPSLSGNATEFQINGTTPWSDVLWVNPVIGQFSTQGLPDNDQTLVPTIHNFIYTVDFYVTDLSVTWALEFDVNMYFDSVAMTWAHQCNYLGDGDWDISVNSGWHSTGISCRNMTQGWNHLTLQMQRGDDNSIIFQSVTLNGVTSSINQTVAPYSVPASWYGITVAYQIDGDYKESANTTYLDNLSLTYW